MGCLAQKNIETGLDIQAGFAVCAGGYGLGAASSWSSASKEARRLS